MINSRWENRTVPAKFIYYERQPGRSILCMHAKTGEIIEAKYENHFPESLEQLNANNVKHFIEMDLTGGI